LPKQIKKLNTQLGNIRGSCKLKKKRKPLAITLTGKTKNTVLEV